MTECVDETALAVIYLHPVIQVELDAHVGVVAKFFVVGNLGRFTFRLRDSNLAEQRTKEAFVGASERPIANVAGWLPLLLTVLNFRVNMASTKFRVRFLLDLWRCQGRAIARRSEPLILL